LDDDDNDRDSEDEVEVERLGDNEDKKGEVERLKSEVKV
jgi:hypothetical protein